MSEYDEVLVFEWLRDGIVAAKAGRRDEARELLMRVVEMNERSAQGWLWLSGVVDSDEDRLICLENVLALEPDNVQARGGLRWLQERGLGVKEEPLPVSEQENLVSPQGLDAAEGRYPGPGLDLEHDLLLAPDGCVYCGSVVSETDERCSRCGGRLAVKRFKHEKRRIAVSFLLQPFWMLLAGLDVVEFFLIGYFWNNVDNISSLFRGYLPYFVGQTVTNPAGFDAFIETELLVQIFRFALVGLAVLAMLVAAGVFMRLSWMHSVGLALIAVHLVFLVLLFALGFSGYFFAAFRATITLLLTLFMFQSVEDFGKEFVRERLEFDRHLVSDVDFYHRGRGYSKRGMWAKALLHWQRAVVIDSNRDIYFAAVAQAYANLGCYELALAQMDQALRVSRTPEEWQSLREVILKAQRRGAANQSL